MRQITALGNDVKQKFRMLFFTNETIEFFFEYRNTQSGWYWGFTFRGRTIINMRLVLGANIIREFRNTLPFGIACTATDNEPPLDVNDFLNGRVSIYLIEGKDEIEYIENYYKRQ
jgi:hypothetical protein